MDALRFFQFFSISFLLLVAPLTFAGWAQSTEDVYFASDPAVSPDGSTLIFSYENDLWKVDASGGTASRLTGMEGKETAASVSPDGKWVAFSSSQYGNNDVYLIPVEGGEIQRLTYHQADDNVQSWSWDSETIFFESGRENRNSTYRVSVSGGTPERLFEHYHNIIHNYVEHPETDEIFFNETWESSTFAHRKKYRGPYNPDIKSYNTTTGELEQHTDWEGKDFWPMIDHNGNLYFVSDQANGEYNLYTFRSGEKTQLTDFITSVRNPSISADGSIIVFEKEYRLYTYHTGSGETMEVPVSVFRNNTLSKKQSFNVKNNITAFDISPDRKKMAFVSRGELFVSDDEGKFIQKLETDSMGRVLEVKWLNDNKTLLFNQTVKGYQNWFTLSADGSGTAQQLTNDRRNNRLLELDADRTRGVYLSGRDELRLIDLESMESRTIVADEFWGFQNEQPRFSPDGEYVLYTVRRDFELDIFAYHIEDDQTINLTKTGISESGPFWSPDGKYIYFSSSRVRPSYPRGSGETDLYRMALDSYEDPYPSEEFAKLFEESEKEDEEKDSKSDRNNVEITINRDGLMQRLEQVGVSFGSQSSPFVTQEDQKTHVLYHSNHSEGKTSLWVTTLEPFENPETRAVKNINGFVTGLTEIDGNLYGLADGSVYRINLSSAEASKIETGQTFNRNLRNEFNQMFEELWANIEENFYNDTFHGIDWEAVRERYRNYLPFINSRDDFRRMTNDMLGELNSSHMGFSTFGEEEQEYYQTVTTSTGIEFDKNNPYRVQRVVADTPADKGNKNIRPGDVLIAVNGDEVDPSENRERYFSMPEMPDELKLTFKRNGESSLININFHPTSYFSVRSALYDEWTDQKQQMVDEQSDKRIAYVHMKNMGSGELENFLIEMTSETYQREALILDLRYNTGGNVHDDVLQFLSQRTYLQWKYRNGEYADQPNFTPADQPIVLLINEQSLSDAEMTAAGFKELGLGTVIGMPTYRWIIFTSGKGLVDGSFYRLPSWGVYTFDEQNLEKTGVEPDIRVNQTFKDLIDGNDPQLQRAIRHILTQLDG